MHIKLIVIILVLLYSCQSKSQLPTVKNDNELSKIMGKFYSWQEGQISNKKLRSYCPTNEDSIAMEFDLYKNDYRFALSKDLNISLKDINNDGKVDALISFFAEDCWNGSGYIGDYNREVLIISKNDEFFSDSTIVQNIKSQFYDLKSRVSSFEERSYLTISKLTYDGIEGSFSIFVESDPNCCASLSGTFFYSLPYNKANFNFEKSYKTVETQ